MTSQKSVCEGGQATPWEFDSFYTINAYKMFYVFNFFTLFRESSFTLLCDMPLIKFFSEMRNR